MSITNDSFVSAAGSTLGSRGSSPSSDERLGDLSNEKLQELAQSFSTPAELQLERYSGLSADGYHLTIDWREVLKTSAPASFTLPTMIDFLSPYVRGISGQTESGKHLPLVIDDRSLSGALGSWLLQHDRLAQISKDLHNLKRG